MGHSMGGAEVIVYAARGPGVIRSQIQGFLAESPYIALHPSTQPSRMTVVAGKLASKILPKRQMVQKLQAKWMVRLTAIDLPNTNLLIVEVDGAQTEEYQLRSKLCATTQNSFPGRNADSEIY